MRGKNTQFYLLSHHFLLKSVFRTDKKRRPSFAFFFFSPFSSFRRAFICAVTLIVNNVSWLKPSEKPYKKISKRKTWRVVPSSRKKSKFSDASATANAHFLSSLFRVSFFFFYSVSSVSVVLRLWKRVKRMRSESLLFYYLFYSFELLGTQITISLSYEFYKTTLFLHFPFIKTPCVAFSFFFGCSYAVLHFFLCMCVCRFTRFFLLPRKPSIFFPFRLCDLWLPSLWLNKTLQTIDFFPRPDSRSPFFAFDHNEQKKCECWEDAWIWLLWMEREKKKTICTVHFVRW